MYMQTYIDGWFWTNWEICMLQQRTKRICPLSIWKTSKQIKYTTQLLQINKENQSSDCCALSLLESKTRKQRQDKTSCHFFCIVSVSCRISENNDNVLHSTPLNTHTCTFNKHLSFIFNASEVGLHQHVPPLASHPFPFPLILGCAGHTLILSFVLVWKGGVGTWEIIPFVCNMYNVILCWIPYIQVWVLVRELTRIIPCVTDWWRAKHC